MKKKSKKNKLLPPWKTYKYGCFRLIGTRMQCYASQKTLPSGYHPIENAEIQEFYNSRYEKVEFYIEVKTKKV